MFFKGYANKHATILSGDPVVIPGYDQCSIIQPIFFRLKKVQSFFSKKIFLLVDSTLHRFILLESMVRHWAPRIIFPCHFSGVLVIILRLNLWSLNWSLFLCSPVTSHHSQYFTCWSPSPLLHLTMKSTWRLFGLIDVSVYWGRITCVLIIYY